MKNKATGFLKRIVSMLTSMAKAKSLALKNKTNALKARLIIMSLLRSRNVNLMSSISHKLQNALTGKQHKEHEDEEEGSVDGDDQSNAIVVYNRKLHNSMSIPENLTYSEIAADDDQDDNNVYGYEENMDEKYPDLTHSLFELEDEDPGGSVIELVKKTKKEGEEFRLEDEIDQVADLFIRRFHKQMRMQKQLSLKRHQQDLLDHQTTQS